MQSKSEIKDKSILENKKRPEKGFLVYLAGAAGQEGLRLDGSIDARRAGCSVCDDSDCGLDELEKCGVAFESLNRISGIAELLDVAIGG